jgi:hypothetical protein
LRLRLEIRTECGKGWQDEWGFGCGGITARNRGGMFEG